MNVSQLLLENQQQHRYQFQDKAQLTDVGRDKSGCTRIKIISPRCLLKAEVSQQAIPGHLSTTENRILGVIIKQPGRCLSGM